MAQADNQILGGCILLARRVFRSPVWLKPPLYFRLWAWLLGQASHVDHKHNGRPFRRGELVTTYHAIREGLAYYENRRLILPSIKQIRLALDWFASEKMVTVEPLHKTDQPELGPTGADTTARTRAYVGLRISVVNYATYQDLELYKGRHQDRPISPQGQYYKNDYKKGLENQPGFSKLRERYPDQALLDQVFKAIASTRKSGRVAESVLVAQLKKWERFPVAQVEAGLRTYMAKDYAAEGKDEHYIHGIIRRADPELEARPRSDPAPNLGSLTEAEWVERDRELEGVFG